MTEAALPFKFPLRVTEIQEILPHRFPFLLVDQVTEYVAGKGIVGFKNVSCNEPFFQGHFPGRPIMPGVLILESLAQLGAIFAKLHPKGSAPERLIVFSGADEVRFRKQVIPGDILRLELTLLKMKFAHWKMQGVATVSGDVVAEAILMATEVD